MKKYLFALIAVYSASTMAAGGSNVVVPTGIDIVRDEGFMIYGAFGNVGGCTISDRVFVKASHPQYDQIYATALAALMAGKKVSAYVHTCEPVLWYSVVATTYNTLTSAGTLVVRN